MVAAIRFTEQGRGEDWDRGRQAGGCLRVGEDWGGRVLWLPPSP